MRPRAARKLASAGIALAALACLWFFFAPVALGGRTTYVVTHGVSMEPRFHSGDLAVVRARSSYRVGEVVAYHSNTFHTIVLHRIIARAGERYVFKGDNNNFVDFEHPLRSQLIGSLWIHVPAVGADLASLSSPALVGGLIGLAVLLFSGAVFTRRRRLRGRARREQSPARSRPAPSFGELPAQAVTVLTLGALAMLPLLVLALLAFTLSETSKQPYQVHYRQTGSLSYAAQTTPGPAYEDGRAVTGEPLFTHVLSHVALRFAYHFHSEAPHSLAGTSSMQAALTSTNGWSYTLALAPPRRFRGNGTTIDADLDLAALSTLVKRVESDTEASGSYTLALKPRFALDAHVAERSLRTTFAPAIQFSLDAVELRPTTPGEISGSSSATAHALNPSTSGTLSGRRSTPMRLMLVVASVSVADARVVSIAGLLAVALVVAAALMLTLARPQRRDEGERIRARFGHLIVPVQHVGQLPGVPVIDVSGIDALVRIAGHYERSILHERSAAGEAFWVTDESGQFRYVPQAASAPEWVEDAHPGAWEQEPVDAHVPEEHREPAQRTAEHPAVPAAVPAGSEIPLAYEPPPAYEPPLAYESPSAYESPAAYEPPLASEPPLAYEPPPAYEPPYDPAHQSGFAPVYSEITLVDGAPPVRVRELAVPQEPGFTTAVSPPAAEVVPEAGDLASVDADPWAEQVVADALASGNQDLRAACEAAGVLFDAPPGTRDTRD